MALSIDLLFYCAFWNFCKSFPRGKNGRKNGLGNKIIDADLNYGFTSFMKKNYIYCPPQKRKNSFKALFNVNIFIRKEYLYRHFLYRQSYLEFI